MDTSTSAAMLALVGTIFGGAGLKIIESVLGKNKRKTDVALSLRGELREDIVGLRAEVHELEKSLDEWRDKYYKLLAEHSLCPVK